jgi:hypothetical protein
VRRISAAIGNVIGGYRTTLSINLKLKSKWNDIIGERLTDETSFHDARYVGPNALAVTINTLSSAALLVKYNTENIVYNIERLTGVSNVKLYFKHTNSIAIRKEAKTNEIEAPQVIKKQYKIDAEFKNQSLKKALESLKTEMLNAA